MIVLTGYCCIFTRCNCADYAAYSVSKIGVNRLTELQARAFSTDSSKPPGILVNAVSANPTKMDLLLMYLFLMIIDNITWCRYVLVGYALAWGRQLQQDHPKKVWCGLHA